MNTKEITLIRAQHDYAVKNTAYGYLKSEMPEFKIFHLNIL